MNAGCDGHCSAETPTPFTSAARGATEGEATRASVSNIPTMDCPSEE